MKSWAEVFVVLCCIALAGACSADDDAVRAVASEGTAGAPSSASEDRGVSSEVAALFDCVDPAEDDGGIVFIIRNRGFIHVEWDSLLSLLRGEITVTELEALSVAGLELDDLQDVVLGGSADAELLAQTDFQEFIVGVSQPGDPEQTPALFPVIGVEETGELRFLFDCGDGMAEHYRAFARTVPELAELPEYEGFLRLAAETSLQTQLLEAWVGPEQPDQIEQWYAARPIDRVLDADLLGPAPYEALQEVRFEFVAPDWWAGSGLGLCPFLPGTGWTGFCLGDRAAPDGETRSERAWTSAADDLELHLVMKDETTQSLRVVADLVGMWGSGQSLRVEFRPEVIDLAAALEAAEPMVVSPGTETYPVLLGLDNTADLVDVAPTDE